MTTATRTKPVSAELAALQKTRDRLHAKVVAARDKRNGWDETTKALRADATIYAHQHPEEYEGAARVARPGTKAAKLEAAIKERMGQENPYEAEYAEAFAPYEQADEALQNMKRARIDERLAELEPHVKRTQDRMREGWALLREGCTEYA
jgi:hypothetical protein